MHTYPSVFLGETNNLLTWYRMTYRTSVIQRFWQSVKILMDIPQSLIGLGTTTPILFWCHALISSHLYAVATMEYGLDGCKVTIDLGILGMHTHLSMNIICKVEHRRAFRQTECPTLRCIAGNIVVIELTSDRLNEERVAIWILVGIVSHIPEHVSHSVNPCADVVIPSSGNTAKTGIY